MKTIGELRKAIAELPDNAPLGVEIQTNGGDDLEFTRVDDLFVSKDVYYTHNGWKVMDEEIKVVYLTISSDK